MDLIKELPFEKLQELKFEVDYLYNKAREERKESLICEFSEMDTKELKSLIKKWKTQINNVRNNKEYDYLDIRIKIGTAVANAL